MILAFDTYYHENKAKTVCFCFDAMGDDEPVTIYTDIAEGIEEYEPGSFLKRELPCIIRLLEKYNPAGIDLVLVDGFVVLDDDGKIGLGGHLYEYLGKKIPVIGVAKTNYPGVMTLKREIYRGTSRNPLYITALGIDLDKAGGMIQGMGGRDRIPALLKKLDTMTRKDMR
ncbi:MAG TPA: endonuclease V [Spirochaetota bacterium]|nr:endonuclease V [Spirochaetota bacterium]HPV40410.1 endonuclease V [Spirochaetota bacterium]